MVSNSLVTKSFSTSRIIKTSLIEASITWDYPYCPIHNNQLNSLCMYSLVKDELVLVQYLGTHDIALGSFASAQHEL
jgi:hypothetical protein